MDRDFKPIPLAYARPKVSARLGSRMFAAVLLWAAALLTVLLWMT